MPQSEDGPSIDESALHESWFRAFFDTSNDCLFHVKPGSDGSLMYEAMNSGAMKHVPVSWAEAKGQRPRDVIGGQPGRVIQDNLRRVYESGRPFRYQPTLRMAAGEITVDAVYSPVRDDAGNVVGVVGVASDVSARLALERHLRREQKLEALAFLAGGVAHDFNNLLGGFRACLTLLGNKVSNEKERRLISEGLQAIEYGSAVARRLLTFSRNQPLDIAPVALGPGLRALTEMLARNLGSDIAVALELASDSMTVLADRNELELAIINLAVNARDAMPEGGSILIKCGYCDYAREGPAGLRPGRYVSIAVADTGHGVPRELLGRVMEPFYTTKPEGKGTGLGLNIVRNMLRQIGGEIELESTVGAGTTATMYLPAR